jgi:hypothetical protein
VKAKALEPHVVTVAAVVAEARHRLAAAMAVDEVAATVAMQVEMAQATAAAKVAT